MGNCENINEEDIQVPRQGAVCHLLNSFNSETLLIMHGVRSISAFTITKQTKFTNVNSEHKETPLFLNKNKR